LVPLMKKWHMLDLDVIYYFSASQALKNKHYGKKALNLAPNPLTRDLTVE
jgi:hypothetical protein